MRIVICNEHVLDVLWPFDLPQERFLRGRANAPYSACTEFAGIRVADIRRRELDQVSDGRWFSRQALNQEAPVFHALAHCVVKDDKLRVVAHVHVKWREEGAAARYCERRVLQFASQFLEPVNGGLSFF